MSLKTQETNQDVDAYIDSIENESKRDDARDLITLMKEVTGNEPKLWGNNGIIGFGNYTYRRKGSKQEYDWFHVGFATRKTKHTVYLSCDITQHQALLDKLGKHKHGKGCLYINKLADVDMEVLRQLVEEGKEAQWHSGN